MGKRASATRPWSPKTRVGNFLRKCPNRVGKNAVQAANARRVANPETEKSASGVRYYGRRYYDPKDGRFVGRDPLQEKGGMNLYAFVANNTVNTWDYLGMHAEDMVHNFHEKRGRSRSEFDNVTTEIRSYAPDMGALLSGIGVTDYSGSPTIGKLGGIDLNSIESIVKSAGNLGISVLDRTREFDGYKSDLFAGNSSSHSNDSNSPLKTNKGTVKGVSLSIASGDSSVEDMEHGKKAVVALTKGIDLMVEKLLLRGAGSIFKSAPAKAIAEKIAEDYIMDFESMAPDVLEG